MSMRKLLLLAGLVGLFAPLARADVKPHPLFTDNMVLQQGVKTAVFGLAAPDESITVTLGGTGEAAAEAKAGSDGRWIAALPAQKAGTGYTLTIKGKDNSITLKNVAVGEVWVCSGQSNMEWSVNIGDTPENVAKQKAESKNPKLRLFTVQKKTAPAPVTDQEAFRKYVSSSWVEAGPDTIGSFSAVGYHFGAYLQKNLPGDVPVGLIHSSWGGTIAEAWTSLEALDAVEPLKQLAENGKKAAEGIAMAQKNFDPEKAKAAYEAAVAKYKDALAKHMEAVEEAKKAGKTPPKAPTPPQPAGVPQLGPNTSGVLYNAMIHQLLQFPIGGAIWYQGESNVGRAKQYQTLLPTLIQDWRTKWKSDVPFMVVQLAPFRGNTGPMGVDYAELREAQYIATTKLPKVGLAVITDVGDLNDIHPRPKKPVGDRLAIAALNLAYGQKNEPIGPTFKDLKIEGDKAVVTFSHLGGGLVAKGEKITGFTIAGEDQKFVDAEAEIAGDTVVVKAGSVTKPVAVRFGFINFPKVNLWSKDGLPAVPFRTDDFAAQVAPKPAPKK